MEDNRESRSRWCRCRPSDCATRDFGAADAGTGSDIDAADVDHSQPFSNRIAGQYRRRASRARPQPEARYQWHGARHPNRRTG